MNFPFIDFSMAWEIKQQKDVYASKFVPNSLV